MTDRHQPPLVCTPPRSWILDDGTTIREGSRVRHTPTGDRGHPMPADAIGIVVEFAGPGWALVQWDRGGQALTHPSDLTTDSTPPPPTCQGIQ
jgi:hypothetical protein